MDAPERRSRPDREAGTSNAIEALERRLAAEDALDRALDIPGLPARAAWVVEKHADRALWTDPPALRAWLTARPDPTWDAERLHAVTLLHDARLASLADVDDADALEAVRRAGRCAAEGWAWLAQCGHVGALVERLADARLGAAARADVADRASRWGLDALVALVEEGLANARAPSRGSAAALALRDLAEDARPPELRDDAHIALARIAARWTEDATTRLDEACLRANTTDVAPIATELHAWVEVWRYLGREVAIERALLTSLPELAWPRYRAGALEGVKQLATAIEPCIHSMLARLRGAPERELAYAAPTAQALTFLAEGLADRASAMLLLESALEVCPGHRNARIVLSNLLCDRAESRVGSGDRGAARHDLERALQLLPESKRAASLLTRHGLA